MYKKLIILSLPILLAACAAPKYTVEAISEENQSKEITIVKDDATRDVFLDSVQEWCLDTAHKCTVVSDGTLPKSSELTLTYVSRWSWDFRTFIADAQVKAYKNSKKVGEVEFKAPNSANSDKWGNDNKRIIAMIDLLFGKQSVNEAQFKIKSGEM
ncbi:TPA: Sbal_3080 family lipoprotein [Vibrio diabolicus]